MPRTSTLVRPVLRISGALVVISTAAWVLGSRHVAATESRAVAQPAALVAARPAPVPVAHAVAAPAREPRVRTVAAGTEAAPAQAGMRAFIDPETGALGVPSATAQAHGPVASATVSAPVEGNAADGSPMLILNGQMQEYAVIRIAPDGRRVMDCVPDPNAALRRPLPPASKPVEE